MAANQSVPNCAISYRRIATLGLTGLPACHVLVVAGFFALSVAASFAETIESPTNETLTFERDIRPILKVACFHCHGEQDERQGALDLRLVRLMLDGGESGPGIVPGNAGESLLWELIESDEMPRGHKKLTQQQKTLIRRWLDQGAATARPEPTDLRDARFSFEELNHWSYQPYERPRIPANQSGRKASPIDSFIVERLSQHDLDVSPRASPFVLVRRVTFALTGLPPTPAEVSAFVRDQHPSAYERLVDRLLASPQFGVRWGRHWLDAAGFAESNGGSQDTKRPHAWRYRDYVVNSFNNNKPIDRFLLEQLAGDELIDGELDIRNARHRELLTATGFLRMAPDATQESNVLEDRNQAVADAVNVISSTILGLTVGCAQCHDHKYDPIAIDDYYRFRAIFDPVFPLDQWQQPNSRIVDFTPQAVQTEIDRIEAIAKQKEDDLIRRRNALAQEIQERKLSLVPEADRKAAEVAVKTPRGERTEDQQRLLDGYPMVKPIATIVGLLVEI